MKRLVTSIVAVGLLVSTISPATASAATVNEQLANIQSLLAQIKALQEQINSLKQQQTTLQQSVTNAQIEILSTLGQGSQGDQVTALQTFLALDSSIYPEGMITGYYGPATARAIARFQVKNGLESVGFVGPRTRKLINELLKQKFAQANEIDEDIAEQIEDALKHANIPVATTSTISNNGTCVIPTSPYIGGTPFVSKNGKVKIVAVGNVYIYEDGKHKVIITPNSYVEKDGKKKVIITPHMQMIKDGKNKTIVFCNGNGTTTYPFPFPTPTPTPTPNPSGDTTAPNLSSIHASPSYNTGVVSWITNEVATSKIYYGTTSPILSSSNSTITNNTYQTGHSFNLSNLQPATTYYYVVESKDKKGNTATSSQQSFATTNAPDTTAPSISAIGTSGVSTSSITINWTTNEAAGSRVYYGTATPLNNATASTKVDGALVTSHSLTLTGLTPGTTYYFKVESADAANNITTSTETSFATTALPPVDTTAPTVSGITVTPGSTTASVVWSTNEPATSKMYWMTTTPINLGSAMNVSDATLVTSHNGTITGLTASTTYYLIVESKDAANNGTLSSEVLFNTTN
jgi:peptidoglycan hydrolase-like protein with peptidoglycan-binding domain